MFARDILTFVKLSTEVIGLSKRFLHIFVQIGWLGASRSNLDPQLGEL